MLVEEYPEEMIGTSNFLLIVFLGNGVVEVVTRLEKCSLNGSFIVGAGGGGKSYEFWDGQGCCTVRGGGVDGGGGRGFRYEFGFPFKDV